jgi:glycosyltransferase involved in cell wall biosynthesis
MKVMMASYQAISILQGGPRTQIHSTARYLPASGVETAFFNPWVPFRRGDADLVHLFAANIGTYHLAREIHALGVPMVVSPIMFSTHSPAFVARALKALRLIGRAGRGIWSDYGIMADICAWGKLVLPNTEAEAKMVGTGLAVPHEKITVIPNGVDEIFLLSDPEPFVARYGLRDFILNVGHIGHRRKNVLSLIKALAGIDHPAVVIGRFISGAYGDACRREAAPHKHILLIDGLDHDAPMLAAAYAACDTFVLPSQFETPGIAALEAGLAGAKVVITPYGGTMEYFGEMADYVNPGSVESIRAGILAALERPKTPALSDHIRKNFLWPRVSEKTAVAYARALGKG